MFGTRCHEWRTEASHLPPMTRCWNRDAAVAFFCCCRDSCSTIARWTVIGVIFCRARLVIRSSSVQSVACQAVKHAILCTRATIVLNSSVRHVYMTGVVAPVMNLQRFYVRSVFTMGRSVLSRTAMDVGAMFVYDAEP